MRTKRYSKSPTPDIFTPQMIVKLMVKGGAEFRITVAGSLMVRNLGRLPVELQRMFFDCEHPTALVAAVREHLKARGSASHNPDTDPGCRESTSPRQ